MAGLSDRRDHLGKDRGADDIVVRTVARITVRGERPELPTSTWGSWRRGETAGEAVDRAPRRPRTRQVADH